MAVGPEGVEVGMGIDRLADFRGVDGKRLVAATKSAQPTAVLVGVLVLLRLVEVPDAPIAVVPGQQERRVFFGLDAGGLLFGACGPRARGRSADRQAPGRGRGRLEEPPRDARPRRLMSDSLRETACGSPRERRKCRHRHQLAPICRSWCGVPQSAEGAPSSPSTREKDMTQSNDASNPNHRRFLQQRTRQPGRQP